MTKTADIAREAGLSHGGIFVHFSTKDRLLGEVVSQIGRDLTDRIHAMITTESDFRRVLEVHLACLARHEPTYTTFLRESRLLPRDVLRRWVGIQSAICEHLASVARRAMDAGELRRLPLHLVFNTWTGLVHHYLMNRELFSPHAPVLETRGAELIDYFTELLRPDDPPAGARRRKQ